MGNLGIRDRIAAVQHAIWAHWMTYLFSCCSQNPDGSYVIPQEKVERWKRQMTTSYENLTVKEQASDLEQADKVLKLFQD
jgi:hypothetical protein